MMKGEKNLQRLLANMEPVLHDGEYVFVSVHDTATIPWEKAICTMREKEGITIILSKIDADALQLPYHFIAAWITLNVHSALEAVGLTAAFASALAKEQISCNVVAGYYHDHIFVDQSDAEQAMKLLMALAHGAE